MQIFYDELITIKRLKTLSGSIKNYVATATAEASIQPLGKEKAQLAEGQFGAVFVAYVPIETSVFESDKVRDSKGNFYNVSKVVERDYGAFPYVELLLKKI